jgi:hypothetical protein
VSEIKQIKECVNFRQSVERAVRPSAKKHINMLFHSLSTDFVDKAVRWLKSRLFLPG